MPLFTIFKQIHTPMKNYLVALTLCCFAVISCKKDYTCSCTVTTNGSTTTRTQSAGFEPFISGTDTTTTQPLYQVNTEKRSYTKVSKSDMRSNCFTKSVESLNQSSTSNTAGIYTITTTQSGTKTYDCKIE